MKAILSRDAYNELDYSQLIWCLNKYKFRNTYASQLFKKLLIFVTRPRLSLSHSDSYGSFRRKVSRKRLLLVYLSQFAVFHFCWSFPTLSLSRSLTFICSVELIYLLLPCLLFKYLHSIRLKYISKKCWRNRNLHDSFTIVPGLHTGAYVFLDCRWSIRKYVYMTVFVCAIMFACIFLHLCEFLFFSHSSIF